MNKYLKKINFNTLPNHIAIIMDGNGRWAKKRGLSRSYGHKAGANNLKNIIFECSDLGIKVLSVYAFSTENWKRPKEEVNYLMELPFEFLDQYKNDFDDNEIRIIVSGRKDRIPLKLKDKIDEYENKTRENNGMIFNICFDYGSYDEMLNAINIAHKSIEGEIKKKDIEKHLFTSALPNLDLLIRTSGELRISNFMLWQLSYAELYFTKVLWPDFKKKELHKAIVDYQKRERRFGKEKGNK